LGTTQVIIATAVLVYRYDFPSIDTYTAFVGENSLTKIVNNTFAFAQKVVVILYTKITGDIVVAGDLTAENLIVGSTNLITELTSLNTRLDTEEPKTSALQTLTATHTDDIDALQS
jgi:tRNA A-37 threonylcarbamoyl transferase component Bud32